MWRQIHLWVALFLSILVMALALTGAVLASKPLYESYTSNTSLQAMSVADVVKKVKKKNKRINPQKLLILPSGKNKFKYNKSGKTREKSIDFSTGKLKKIKKEHPFYIFMRDLHRSFFLGDKGRLIPAISGIAMSFLTISGFIILIRRAGGIRALLSKMSWRGLSNQHSVLGRWLLVPLLIMSLTAVWLSGVTYKIVPSGSGKPPAYPESLEELDPIDPWDLEALQNIPMTSVREVVFPIPEDWFDVWAVKTDSEFIFVDQFTGKVLNREPLNIMEQVMEWVMVLHTGEGTIWWAIVLMISALAIPFFAITGTIMWWRGKKLRGGRIRQQSSTGNATTLILVGSEGGSTWGFAKALHDGLTQAGEKVRTIEMNALAKNYPNIKNLLVLVATYGDGDAPQSAKKFMSRLDKLSNQDATFATLAFGDQAFPKFCAYGREVDEVLKTKFPSSLLELTEVDKRSAQTFSIWCQRLNDALGEALDSELVVNYVSKRPKTRTLSLVDKVNYGEAMNVPMSVLQFGGKVPKHQAGDWLAAYAPDCDIARLYSLGSSSKKDKKVEICVRKQEGGVCSPWLCGLEKSDTIEICIIKNPHFHVPKKRPVIMIGAGTGLAPFVGMIRHNAKKQDMTLYWGGRNPEVDGIYGDELNIWLEKGCLTHFFPAWSRFGDEKMYVQDVIAKQHDFIQTKLSEGATIMICGGRTMANAVEQEIDIVAQKMGLSVELLKQKNRYLEDVY